MEIKLLGAKSCKTCQGLEQTLQDVLAELEVNASIVKVYDINDILQYDVFAMPGLIINNELKAAGRVPSKLEITSWIHEAL